MSKLQFFHENELDLLQIFCNVHIGNVRAGHILGIILLLLIHFHNYDRNLFSFFITYHNIVTIERLFIVASELVETINGLKRVLNDKTSFQKSQQEYWKLQPNKYTLVASVLKSESDKYYDKINNILKSSVNVNLSRIFEDSGFRLAKWSKWE